MASSGLELEDPSSSSEESAAEIEAMTPPTPHRSDMFALEQDGGALSEGYPDDALCTQLSEDPFAESTNVHQQGSQMPFDSNETARAECTAAAPAETNAEKTVTSRLSPTPKRLKTLNRVEGRLSAAPPILRRNDNVHSKSEQLLESLCLQHANRFVLSEQRTHAA